MKYIFFDLDSTLLQMDQDLFVKKYFNAIGSYAKNYVSDTKTFMDAFMKAAYMIVLNDGSMTNEEKFWSTIEAKIPNARDLMPVFNKFYENEFNDLQEGIVNKSNLSNEIIKKLKNKGYKIVLATNPLFPKIATLNRIKWAGLDYNDFELITTYENSTFCKPNRNYYYEIAKKLNIKLDGIYMIGNDVDDDFKDLPEEMNKILITDYLINRNNKEHGILNMTLKEFNSYIDKNF